MEEKKNFVHPPIGGRSIKKYEKIGVSPEAGLPSGGASFLLSPPFYTGVAPTGNNGAYMPLLAA